MAGRRMTTLGRGARTDRAGVIAAAIRNAIIEQAIRPGARLPEDTIGERFGASRTIVRAALAQLAAEGLVNQRRNRGAVVAKPSWNEARDTFDIRLAVEDIVMQRIVGRLTADQLAVLQRHVDAEAEASARGDDPHSIRLAGEFHVLLADFTDSDILYDYMRELVSRCCLILSLYARPHSAECGVVEHQELVDLLASGDVDACMKAMRNHMQLVVDRALIAPPVREERNIGDILSSYIEGNMSTPSVRDID